MNKQRLQRVLDNMEAQGLDQILVTSTASVFYLTGYWIEPHERMLALYIDKNGRTALYGNEIFGVEATADLPVIPHADSADPVADLAAALAPGRLGVDKFWPSKFLTCKMGRTCPTGRSWSASAPTPPTRTTPPDTTWSSPATAWFSTFSPPSGGIGAT